MTMSGFEWIPEVLGWFEHGWVLLIVQAVLCLHPGLRKYCWVLIMLCLGAVALTFILPNDFWLMIMRDYETATWGFGKFSVTLSAAIWVSLGLALGGILVWVNNCFKRK
ncbi:MAG: hypothetical protein IKC09_06320 [Oscillospiraceae bacterium]|nr:hypothetical protein [Oscillospiraceae bacterium]